MHPQLDKLFDLIPSRCPHVVVAGGAAANLESAGDVDLWFLNNNIKGAERFLEAQKVKLSGASKSYKDGYLLVGEFYSPLVKKIVQVLSVKAETAADLLSTFDLSAHMVAVNARGKLFTLPETTALDAPLRVHAVHARGTMTRYIKLCGRLGQAPDEQLLDLLEMVVNQCEATGTYPEEIIKGFLSEYYAKGTIDLLEVEKKLADPF